MKIMLIVTGVAAVAAGFLPPIDSLSVSCWVVGAVNILASRLVD